MSESSTETYRVSADYESVSAKLAAANQAGKGLAWTCFFLALIWWSAAGFGLYSLSATSTLASQPAGLLIAGLGFAILPGFILLLAGFIARQNKRTHAANVLLLQASQGLLTPAHSAAEDIKTLAEATRYSTAIINQTSTAALKALKDMSEAMASERLRVESVSYAMADNARDLTLRLSEERAALETLSRALSDQVTIMGNALPRQANAMKDATLAANSEVAKADAALAARIEQMKHASSSLATRLIDLDAVARDASRRTEALYTTITRIEDKLGQSHKAVEMAERASTMAVNAATQTSNALKDAVSAALDGARDANREIAENTRIIQETAASAMAELRKTGIQAANAAARVQEQSLGISADSARTSLFAPMPVPDAAPLHVHVPITGPVTGPITGPVTGRDIVTAADIETFEQGDAPHLRLRKQPSMTELSLKTSAKRPLKTRRVYTDEIDPVEETRPEALEEDLFEMAAPPASDGTPTNTETERPRIAARASFHAETAPTPEPEQTAAQPQILELGSDPAPVFLNRPHLQKDAPKNAQPNEWRHIIADIGHTPEPLPQRQSSQHTKTVLPREATAEELISRLQISGIPLPTAFRSRDKRKIAAAARKDEQSRRRAIRLAAGSEVDRVTVRLTKDDQLMELARNFVSAEKAEALKALEDTGNSGRHASTRLSAYLLVDAALEPILRN